MAVQALALAHRLSLPVIHLVFAELVADFLHQFLLESNVAQISHIYGPLTGAAMSDRHHIER
jgi:hypothetical protein